MEESVEESAEVLAARQAEAEVLAAVVHGRLDRDLDSADRVGRATRVKRQLATRQAGMLLKVKTVARNGDWLRA